MKDSDIMSAGSPPKGAGVKKVNKNPILIVFGILFLLIMGLGYATMKRGESVQGSQGEQTKKIDGDNEQRVGNMLNDLYSNRKKGTQPTKTNTAAATPTSNAPDALPSYSDHDINTNIDEAAMRLQKLRQDLYLQSLSSPTKIAVKGFTQASSVKQGVNSSLSSLQNDSLAFMNKLHEQKLSIEDDNTIFMKQQNSFDYLTHKKSAPYSKYEIKTGAVIPSILITGISSELPGAIKAQVSENVYDTATGDYLLIPQGTTMVGKYSSHIQFGQSRVLISWNRLIFADGKTLNIGNMNGVDQEGYTGFEDQVDNHYFQIFGSAFLLSLLSGDFFFEDGYLVISGQASAGVQTSPSPMEQAAQQMIQKQLAVAPTINIRPGYKFNIFVTKDIILEPVEN